MARLEESMNESNTENEGLLKQIAGNLESIFRHMLPGSAILLTAYAAHPKWFDQIHFDGGWHLAGLATVAVVAGNSWYLLHRFFLHQLIDLAAYCWLLKKPLRHYSVWLADHIGKSYLLRERLPYLSNHIYVRSAQVIFLFVVSENALLFTLKAQDGTFYQRHTLAIALVSLLGIAVAISQQILLFRIDADTASKLHMATPSEPSPVAKAAST
jgi:hypothetical protein